MEIVKLRIRGTRPILMHADVLSDPLHPITQEHKKLTAKRKKTMDDHIAIAKSEWRSGLYFDDELGPVIPNHVIFGAIHQGAKKSKLGKLFLPGVEIVEENCALQYDGPRDVEGLWSQRFYDVRSVVVSRSRIQRYRPIFRRWWIDATIAYNPELVDHKQVITAAADAGEQCGIGDYRPKFGRFIVEELQ